MRYTDFWIVESIIAENKASQLIDNVINKVATMDLTKISDEALNKANEFIIALTNKANNLLADFTKKDQQIDQTDEVPQTVQTGFTEAVATNQPELQLTPNLLLLKVAAESICQKGGPQVCADYLKELGLSDLSELPAFLLKGQETAAFKAYKDLFKLEEKLINIVSLKITGELKQYKNFYIEQLAKLKNNVDAEGNPAPIEHGVELEEAKNNALKKVDQSAVSGQVRMILQGHLAQWKGHTYANPEQAHELDALIEKFLKESEEGIIKLAALLKKGSGNILDEVRSIGTYDALLEPVKGAMPDGSDSKGFIPELLELKPSGSGAGAWGPGELGLALLGTPVNKSEKGDLVVGTEKFELKASMNPKSGGRINTDAVMRGKDGITEFNAAWRKFTAKVPIGITKNKKNQLVNISVQDPNVAGSKSISYTTIGPTWIKIVNEALANYKTEHSSKKTGKFNSYSALAKWVKDFIKEVLTAPISGEYKAAARAGYKLDRVVIHKKGSPPQISDHGLLGEYTRQLLEFYQQTDQIGKILIINPRDSHFEVVSAKDPKGLMRKIKSGTVQVGTTYIGFTDTQSKATPQYGTKGL